MEVYIQSHIYPYKQTYIQSKRHNMSEKEKENTFTMAQFQKKNVSHPQTG